jgi:pimeloyl-ACP methyl ester carboxylesterase
MSTTVYVHANGLRFEVETAGEGDRLALCLHGFPEHAISWRHQLPLLAELGYRAWAPNQRGYGNTTRPAERAAYEMKHLLADAAGLIDASGAKSVTLIGHDWGAMVAWFFAIRRVRPLERLVIMNVPHPLVFRARAKTLPQALRSWYVAFFQLPSCCSDSTAPRRSRRRSCAPRPSRPAFRVPCSTSTAPTPRGRAR